MNTEELKRLALAATPGPWFVVGQPWNPKADFIVAGSNEPHMGQYVADTEDFDGEGKNVQENAAWIAAANPAAILSLIEERDELLEALKAIVSNRDKNYERQEEFVSREKSPLGPYWSPAATMVDSDVIASARAAIAKVES